MHFFMPKFSLGGLAQWRYGRQENDRLLLDLNLNLGVANNTFASTGYTVFGPTDPLLKGPERRPWLGIQNRTAFSHFVWNNRARVEFRQLPGQDQTAYRGRFLSSVVVPDLLGVPEIGTVVENEVLVNLNDLKGATIGGFAENWFRLALQKTIVPGVNVDVGYMNQFIKRQNTDNLSINIFALFLSSSL
jgi:hypothetical protein